MENLKVFNRQDGLNETTNQAQLVGTIENEPVFSHEIVGEKFYKTSLRVQRLSEEFDILPLTVSERLIQLNPTAYKKNANCGVLGQFRSYNKLEDGKSRLILEVFVEKTMSEKESLLSKDAKQENFLTLKGFVCKVPIYRETPFGRQICDILMAVNRNNSNKSDYIPCIAWGRNAVYMASKEIGDEFVLKGRIQSRDYQKTIDGQSQTRTAYEVSVHALEQCNDKPKATSEESEY